MRGCRASVHGHDHEWRHQPVRARHRRARSPDSSPRRAARSRAFRVAPVSRYTITDGHSLTVDGAAALPRSLVFHDQRLCRVNTPALRAQVSAFVHVFPCDTWSGQNALRSCSEREACLRVTTRCVFGDASAHAVSLRTADISRGEMRIRMRGLGIVSMVTTLLLVAGCGGGGSGSPSPDVSSRHAAEL